MDCSLTTSVLIILSCLWAAMAGRTKLYQSKGQDGMFEPPPVGSCSLCKAMVEPQGYACQEHSVTTQDGYVLGVQRMQISRSGKKADKPPVLLQHGIFIDGGTWLLNSPDQSLAFILVDNGYDVWIANTRGTICSMAHKSLSPDDSAYWEWSWDELVAFDLPATVQYVHDQTAQKLHYVGHSLGTLIALAAVSRGQLLHMLRSAALLCPIAHLNQIRSPLIKVAADMLLATDLYWLGLREFVPGEQAVTKLIEDACKTTGADCSFLMPAFTGPTCCVNNSKIDAFLNNEPQPTSTKNVIHLCQMIKTGDINMYDYGNKDDNMNHYQQPTPPIYDMTNVPKDLPLYLAYGGQDTLADVNDVQVLLGNLKDHDKDKLVIQYVEGYAHVDFVFGVNANQLVYNPMVAFFGIN
ncbi:hypothetical protein K2173_018745 [Erythroxylum novogranatense]|uniref:Lipase n=1 Tax=Erythroxylum novogranatense TaxID=1862640 RepID=A0AAV8SBA8_9ROSI|nr:hypothetical protein K2173_018745 [Erythroxylum novogranatense]